MWLLQKYVEVKLCVVSQEICITRMVAPSINRQHKISKYKFYAIRKIASNSHSIINNKYENMTDILII